MKWGYPSADNVAMDILEHEFQDGAWVGSWQSDEDDERPCVIVLPAGGFTEDGTRYDDVEIAVEAQDRRTARETAGRVRDVLLRHSGETVNGVLVDSVGEVQGPDVVPGTDDEERRVAMVYTLAFRKQLL